MFRFRGCLLSVKFNRSHVSYMGITGCAVDVDLIVS